MGKGAPRLSRALRKEGLRGETLGRGAGPRQDPPLPGWQARAVDLRDSLGGVPRGAC